MLTPDRGLPRLLRALALAVVLLGLAGAAHVLGGGALPHPGVLAGVVGLVVAAALVITPRRLSTRRLLAVLGAGELALHHTFALLAANTLAPVEHSLAPGGALAGVVGAGHHGHGYAVVGTVAGSVGSAGSLGAMDDMGHATGAAGLLMLTAHVVATVVTAVVLARGEAALWLLAAWLLPVLVLVRQLWALPVLLARPAYRTATYRPLWTATVAPRRGPPTLVPSLG